MVQEAEVKQLRIDYMAEESDDPLIGTQGVSG